MASKSLDRARSRFISAIRRIDVGLQLQKRRLDHQGASAPRLMEDTEYEVVDHTDVPGVDLDYYIYELGRLQDVAREVIKVFDSPNVIIRALNDFDESIPNLRRARNPLTHPSDDSRLDDFGWFAALVRLLPNGNVQYLIDPRDHHQPARDLVEALLSYLRAGIRPVD